MCFMFDKKQSKNALRYSLSYEVETNSNHHDSEYMKIHIFELWKK